MKGRLSKDAVYHTEAVRPGLDVSLMGVYLPGDYPTQRRTVNET